MEAEGSFGQTTPVTTRSRTASRPARILLVDDESLLVACQAAVLERYGHKVTAVTDPRDALALVRANPAHFDVVISDLVMPEIDGIELSARLASLRPELPIIILTGTPPNNGTLGYGIRKLLVKPAPSREVHAAVVEVLEEVL